MIWQLIICIIWFCLAIIMMPDISLFGEINFGQRLIIAFLVIIGAPFMLISQAIEMILDSFIDGGGTTSGAK